MPAGPTPFGLTSRTCRQADIEHDWLRHWSRQLGTPPVYHRKLWEDCFVLQALWEAGMLAPGRRGPRLRGGAGGAAGDPRRTWRGGGGDRPRWQTRTGARLDRNRPAWQRDRGAVPPGPAGPRRFDALVGFRPADMSRLPADLLQGGFDLVWSVCALEHLGKPRPRPGLRGGGDALPEAGRHRRAHHRIQPRRPRAARCGAAAPCSTSAATSMRWPARLAAAGHCCCRWMTAMATGCWTGSSTCRPAGARGLAARPGFPPHLRLSVRGFPVTSAGIIVIAGGAARA